MVFDRFVFNYLFNQLLKQVLTSSQSGFIGDSSVSYLVFIYDTPCKSLHNGIEVRVVFFDIGNAFDKVWYNGILTKLKLHLVFFLDTIEASKQQIIVTMSSDQFRRKN